MKLTALCLFCLLVSTGVHAQLGQSKKACAERYGEPDEISGDVLTYHKGGVNIRASFVDERAACLLYAVGAKPDSVPQGTVAGFFVDNLGKEIGEKMLRKPPKIVSALGGIVTMTQTDDGKIWVMAVLTERFGVFLFAVVATEQQATALLADGLANLLPKQSPPAQVPQPAQSEETVPGPQQQQEVDDSGPVLPADCAMVTLSSKSPDILSRSYASRDSVVQNARYWDRPGEGSQHVYIYRQDKGGAWFKVWHNGAPVPFTPWKDPFNWPP